MIVLLHFKVLQIHRQENNTNPVKFMSQAVSQLEFGSIHATVEDEQ